MCGTKTLGPSTGEERTLSTGDETLDSSTGDESRTDSSDATRCGAETLDPSTGDEWTLSTGDEALVCWVHRTGQARGSTMTTSISPSATALLVCRVAVRCVARGACVL